MKKTCIYFLLLATGTILYSCSSGNDHSESKSETKEAVVSNTLPDNINSPQRKLIKTADFKARVTNVFATTRNIEQAASALNGLVTESKTDNNTTTSHQLPYKQDSFRQVQSYTTTSHMTLRIPVNSVDTFMSIIAGMADFIDNRNLQMNDATLQYISNELKTQTEQGNTYNQAITLAKKSDDALKSGDHQQEQKEKAIDRKIENMNITDQANYATIQIDLYQPEKIDAVIVPNTNYLMRPSFGSQIRSGLANGWYILKQILIVLSNIWTLLILSGLILFVVKKRNKIFKKITL